MFMDRLNVVLGFLVFLNLLPSTFFAFEDEKESAGDLQARITVMEKEFQQFEDLASWTTGAQSALDPPPEEDVTTYVNRFQGLAKAWKFNLQEIAQTGDNPVLISINGVGDYKALANLINEMTKSRAVIPKKIFLAKQDDGLLETQLELSVRFGPWEGTPIKKRMEPIPEPGLPPVLGAKDLFGKELKAPIPPPQQSNVQYLGCFIGSRRPSAILAENGKPLVISQGEKTPAGLFVEKVTPEILSLRRTDGSFWEIPLKKSR